jgi:hypothetical protein
MDADELKRRTKLFALRILKLAAALPNTIEGRAIRGQLVLTIARRAVPDLELNLLLRSESLRKSLTKAAIGSS